MNTSHSVMIFCSWVIMVGWLIPLIRYKAKVIIIWVPQSGMSTKSANCRVRSSRRGSDLSVWGRVMSSPVGSGPNGLHQMDGRQLNNSQHL